MMRERKKDQSIRFFVVSLIGVSALIIGLFVMLSVYMNQKSAETIEEVGKLYMTGMNEQIVLHYETVMELRLSQLSAITETIDYDSEEPRDLLLGSLDYSAKARGFTYLALYSRDGEFEMIYGNPVKAVDPEPFIESLKNGDEKIAVARDSEDKGTVRADASLLCRARS